MIPTKTPRNSPSRSMRPSVSMRGNTNMLDYLRMFSACLGFSLLMGLLAQASLPIPWTVVPITGQTLGVLLAGLILGPRLGFLAMLLYLFEGAIGLPFFAGGVGGFAALMGPSSGYLLSFPFAAAFVGWGVRRSSSLSRGALWLYTIGASLIIYALGLMVLSPYVWLIDEETSFTVNMMSLLWAGMLPFLLGDLVKIFVALEVFERFRSSRSSR